LNPVIVSPTFEYATPATPLSFQTDIKILFRDNPDRVSMLAIGGFDLHRYEDVSESGRADLGQAYRRQHALRRQLATGAHRAVQQVDPGR
jgi:hypothetical protein